MTDQGPFERVDVGKPALTTKLLGRPDAANALLSIQNLLAEANTIREVSSYDIQGVLTKYRIRSMARLSTNLQDLYRTYLRHCLKDHRLSDDEVEDLQHLKQLLGLNDAAVVGIHEDVSSGVYEKTVEQAIRDGRIEKGERDFLDKLERELRLPKELAKSVYEKTARARLQSQLDQAVKDERLSPEEDAEIQAIAKSLGAVLEFGEKTQAGLDRLRLYWAIENGEIPTLAVDIKLQKAEKAYFATTVNWYEQRKVSKRIRYGGPTARIRIAKGLYWRMGDIAVQRVSEDVMTLIDSGYLYLTNKRIIFMGDKRNSTIRLSRILDFNAFTNGVDIQKDAGRSPFFEFDSDIDLFVLLLERVLRDAG